MRNIINITISLLLLSLTGPTLASWSLKTDQTGMCVVRTSFHYKHEQYQLEIFEDQQGKAKLQFIRKHRTHVPGITSLDAFLVRYPKGKTIDLAKLNSFRIESNRTQDIVSTELNSESIEHLKQGRTLSIEYTTNRTDQFAHDVELKFAAENIAEMLQCRKKQTKTRSAQTDKWRFFKSSKALELACHAEISTKRAEHTYRLIYILHDKNPGFIFIDQDKADGEIDSITQFVVTDSKKRIHHLDVEGEFWELNGKEAFFVPVKRSQLKHILLAKNLSVIYSSDKHQNIEQSFRLRGIGSAISMVNKCK